MYTDILAQDSYSVKYIQTQKNDTPFFDMGKGQELFCKTRDLKALQKDDCERLNAHKGFLMARIQQEIAF